MPFHDCSSILNLSNKWEVILANIDKLIEQTIYPYSAVKILRKAMGGRDSKYKLSGIIELDDAYIGGKRTGKRRRGAGEKTSEVVACETNGK